MLMRTNQLNRYIVHHSEDEKLPYVKMEGIAISDDDVVRKIMHKDLRKKKRIQRVLQEAVDIARNGMSNHQALTTL